MASDNRWSEAGLWRHHRGARPAVMKSRIVQAWSCHGHPECRVSSHGRIIHAQLYRHRTAPLVEVSGAIHEFIKCHVKLGQCWIFLTNVKEENNSMFGGKYNRAHFVVSGATHELISSEVP